MHLVSWNLLTSFPCFCNLELPDISFEDLLRFEYITSLFSCLCMSMLTSNSSGNIQKHGCLGCFHAASTRENISWVWEIKLETTSPLPVGWYGYAWNDYQSSLLAAREKKNRWILRLFFKTKFHSEMIFPSNVPNQTLILKNKAHQFQLFFSHQRATIANGLFLNTQCSTWTFHGIFCIPILRLLGHTQFQNGCKTFYSSKV